MSMRCRLGHLPIFKNTHSGNSFCRKSAPCVSQFQDYQDGRPRRQSVDTCSWMNCSCSAAEGFATKNSSTYSILPFDDPLAKAKENRPSQTWGYKAAKKMSRRLGSIAAAAEQIRGKLKSKADGDAFHAVGDVRWALDGCPVDANLTLKQQSQELARRWLHHADSIESLKDEDLAELLADILPGRVDETPHCETNFQHVESKLEHDEGERRPENDRTTPTTTASTSDLLESRCGSSTVESDLSDASVQWLKRRERRRQKRQQANGVTYGQILRAEHEQFNQYLEKN